MSTYPYQHQAFESEFMKSLHGVGGAMTADHRTNIASIKQSVYDFAVQHSPDIEAKMHELMTWEKQYAITKDVPEMAHAAIQYGQQIEGLVANYMHDGKVPSTIPVSELTPVQRLAGLQANIQLRAKAVDGMFAKVEDALFQTAEGQKLKYRMVMAQKGAAVQPDASLRPLHDDQVPVLNDVVAETPEHTEVTAAAAEETSSLLDRLVRHKIKAGLGATAIVAGGGWALHEMNKRQTEEPTKEIVR